MVIRMLLPMVNVSTEANVPGQEPLMSKLPILSYFHCSFWKDRMVDFIQCPLAYVVIWLRNVPHRLMCLNTWSPVGSTVWKGYRNFRGWSLTRGSVSLEQALGVHSFALLLAPSTPQVWMKISPASFLLLSSGHAMPCFPATMDSPSETMS